MTWKELKDKISLMTEEEQRQEVAVWGENMNLMKDCSFYGYIGREQNFYIQPSRMYFMQIR